MTNCAARYSLGDDPFNPHDNILAGTAYLREMYDIYGSPGFLAAYNAGPRRLDDYLSNNRPLPDETRRYVAMIGPEIVGVYPSSRSPAEDYAMNALPIDIPPGTRYGRAIQLASSRGGGGRVPARGAVQVAQLPSSRGPTSQQRTQQFALVLPPPAPPIAWWTPLIQQAVARNRCRCIMAARRPGNGRSRSAPIPTSAGARGTRHGARTRGERARGRAHVGVRRASGARGAVSRAMDRTVARCRGAGLPTARAWPHEQLHGACRRSRSRSGAADEPS